MQNTKLTVSEKSPYENLPVVHYLGADKLTEIFILGKRTLKVKYKEDKTK